MRGNAVPAHVSRFVSLLVLAGAAACGGEVGTSESPSAPVVDQPGVGAKPPVVDDPDRPGRGATPTPTPTPTSPIDDPRGVEPPPFPWDATCPAAPTDAWVPAPLPEGTLDDFRTYADAVRASFVGHWIGKQTVFGQSANVSFDFETSGHYSGVCLDAGQCWATIYRGIDNESVMKKIHLDDLSLDGVFTGSIDLAFPPQPAMGENPNDPPWIPPAGTTVLQHVVLDATSHRLRFDLLSYLENPTTMAHYELWRCP